MEHHRLKPMKDGYDEKLFNELYKKTTPLRRKLAHEIDARKFGVDYQEILSWFDVKFIHTFNKYWDTEPERLMGYIISALSTYKYRIMRSSYQAKYHNHASMVDVTELYKQSDIVLVEDIPHRELYLNKVMEFMKDKLSDDALLVLEIELTPPPFILDQMEDLGKKETHKIPHNIIADYLGYGDSPNMVEYIKELRSQIRAGISLAKKYFEENPSSVFA